jgi:hypothetical protein
MVVREAVWTSTADFLTASGIKGNFRGYLTLAKRGSQWRAWGVPGFSRVTLARRNEA